MGVSKTVGRRIKECRKQSGITQEKLAEKVGISTSFLSRVETGKVTAGFKTYVDICNVLNVTLDWITQDAIIAAKKSENINLVLSYVEKLNETQLDFVIKIIRELYEQGIQNM